MSGNQDDRGRPKHNLPPGMRKKDEVPSLMANCSVCRMVVYLPLSTDRKKLENMKCPRGHKGLFAIGMR